MLDMERPPTDLSVEELEAMLYGGDVAEANGHDPSVTWRLEEETNLDDVVRLVKDGEETPVLLVRRKGWNPHTPGVSVHREVNGVNGTDKRLETAFPGHTFDIAVEFAIGQVVEKL